MRAGRLLPLLATLGGLALVARADARGPVTPADILGLALCALGVGVAIRADGRRRGP